MGIVTAERVNRHLSSPAWTSAQFAEAEDLCEEIEATLADQLNTPITPKPYSETAAILDSGLVATAYPVASVSVLNGQTIAEGDPLPAGWVLVDHRIRQQPPNPLTLTVSTLALFPSGVAARAQGFGAVGVSYQAGYGNEPTLRITILEKVAAIMLNRHDDTVIARGLDASAPAAVPGSAGNWTEQELAPLGRFRNIVGWR